MPKVMTVAEVVDAEADTIVTAFKGKVKAIWKGTRGTGDDGNEWSFQNVVLTDKSGDEIKLKLKGREESPLSWKGKSLALLAHKGTKGWSGLYAKDDEYKGKTTRVLQATKSAEIVVGAGHPVDDDDADVPDDEGDDDGDLGPETESPKSASPKSGALLDAKAFLGRSRNGMLLCLDAAVSCGKEYMERHPDMGGMSAEQFQAITSTFYIAGDRAGIWNDLSATEQLPPPKVVKAKVDEDE